MSLFNTREWWTHKPGTSEEYGTMSMAVGNVDNSSSKHDKIVTGSMEGTLRIFLPRRNEYTVNDLMLEEELNEPILQVSIGKFLGGTPRLAIAVLHPRRLVVYSVVIINPDGGHAYEATEGCFYGLTKNYEHKLPRNSHSFCYGPFGGVHERDFICVQSMDGCYSFFEQEVRGFDRVLHDFLIPGPFTYLQSRDSFIISLSTMEVVCIKYRTFADTVGATPQYIHNTKPTDTSSLLGKLASGEMRMSGVSDPLSGPPSVIGDSMRGGSLSKGLKEEWRANIGENPVAIFVGRCSRMLESSQTDIIVVGEHSLFILKETGGMRRQKRFDRDPAVCAMYPVQGNQDLSVSLSHSNIIVVTFDGVLLVVDDQQTKWASTINRVPVVVSVGSFGDVRNLIVLLMDDGETRLCYLGTDPTSTKAQDADAEEIDYEEVDREQRRLRAIIRNASSGTAAVETTTSQLLSLQAQVPSEPDNPHLSGDLLVTGLDDLGLSMIKGVDTKLRREYQFGGTSANPPKGMGKGDKNAKKIACSFTLRLVIESFLSSDLLHFLHQRHQEEMVHRGAASSDTDSIELSGVKIQLKLPFPYLAIPPSSLRAGSKASNLSPSLSVSLPPIKLTSQMAPLSLDFTVVVPSDTLFTSLNAMASIVYSDPFTNGVRNSTCSFLLPLLSAYRPIPPIKGSNFKLTIDSNKPALAITTLFEDLQLSSDVTSQPSVLSFLSPSGHDASILVSMNTGRYRVQSTTLDGLRVISEELQMRIRDHYAEDDENDEQEPLLLTTSDPIPFGVVLPLIDAHFEIRQNLRETVNDMEKKANLLRAIEKRLLVRCKEKSVSNLSNMDVFFDQTINEQRNNIYRASHLFEELSASSIRLDNAMAVLTFIAELKLQLEGVEREVCHNVIPSPIDSLTPLCLSTEYSSIPSHVIANSLLSQPSSTIVGGWEETTYLSILRAMRSMTRPRKDDGIHDGIETGTIPPLPQFPTDTGALKTTIQQFYEKLSKGYRLGASAAQ
ncbi:putative BBS9 protein [Blattamonas nauphoetae]|uniref:BBS9 protein n=1 Tax=Blattamonas nauphoetae TaxID=2049346 RepID=A0ABQ9YF41_9EUKA|nr:putative BBS9 protein [Blattamonas nauphoetae]